MPITNCRKTWILKFKMKRKKKNNNKTCIKMEKREGTLLKLLEFVLNYHILFIKSHMWQNIDGFCGFFLGVNIFMIFFQCMDLCFFPRNLVTEKFQRYQVKNRRGPPEYPKHTKVVFIFLMFYVFYSLLGFQFLLTV